MSLGPELNNYNGRNVVSDLGSQDTQRSKIKPEGGAVSIKHDRDMVKRKLLGEIPERFLLTHSGRLCILSSEEPACLSGGKPRKQRINMIKPIH